MHKGRCTVIHKLRTIDVWDTLLRRDCHPECIKLSTSLHLYIRFKGTLKERFVDHWEIYRARLEVEADLGSEARAAGNDDEYRLDRVIASWLQIILGGDASDTSIHDVLEYELAAEIAPTYPDEEIIRVLSKRPAEKTIFLSDFYMSSAMLQRLLENKGLSDLVPTGISSCDVGKNKRSGRLFNYVHAAYQVTSAEHFHIGDNLYSDVESPRRLGIIAEHYLPQGAHEDRLMRELLFTSRDILFDHLRRETLLLNEPKVNAMTTEHAVAFRLGLEAAPLFIGFSLYIAEQAILNRLEKIYFFTREGEFFHQIFELLYTKHEYFGHPLPDSEILEVSRLATFAASMDDISVGEFLRIWRLYRTQKVEGLFSTLGLSVADFTSLLEEIGLSPQDVIDIPETDSRLEKLFLSPVFQAAAMESIKHKRALIDEYLSVKGFGKHKNIGVVDIGWRGTIQDNLALIFPQTNIHGMYLGLRRLVNPQPDNVSKSAYGVDECIDSDWAKYFEAFAALEMICCSPNGSVMGYAREDGVVVARKQVCSKENESFIKFSKFFQEGVLSATAIWKPYLERYVVTASDLRGPGLHVWKQLARTPPARMVDAF